MKATKLISAFIVTIVIMWLLLGFISWIGYNNEYTYRLCLSFTGVIFLTILLGLPAAIIIVCDLYKDIYSPIK